MKHRYPGLLAWCGLLARSGFAFLGSSPSAHRRQAVHHHDSNSRFGRAASQRPPGAAALSMAWSAEERTEILRGLVDWQERDLDGVGAAGVKILTESAPTAGLKVARLPAHDHEPRPVEPSRRVGSCCVAFCYPVETTVRFRWVAGIALLLYLLQLAGAQRRVLFGVNLCNMRLGVYVHVYERYEGSQVYSTAVWFAGCLNYSQECCLEQRYISVQRLFWAQEINPLFLSYDV